MKLINDKDGVDVIINDVASNLDFNYGLKKLHELDNLHHHWNECFKDGHAEFSAYQFLCDGLTRRTISLRRFTCNGESETLIADVIGAVESWCDEHWGKIESRPVLFVEREVEERGFFNYLKKLFGDGAHDLQVRAFGDVTMRLIQEHLLRSAKAV